MGTGDTPDCPQNDAEVPRRVQPAEQRGSLRVRGGEGQGQEQGDHLTLSQKRAEVPGNLRGQPPAWGRELSDTAPLASLKKVFPSG